MRGLRGKYDVRQAGRATRLVNRSEGLPAREPSWGRAMIPELGHALGCHDVLLCGLARRGERHRGRHHRTIQEKKVTYDLERLTDAATKLRTSEYAAALISNIWDG